MHRGDERQREREGEIKQTQGQINTAGDRCGDVGVGTVCASPAVVSA